MQNLPETVKVTGCTDILSSKRFILEISVGKTIAEILQTNGVILTDCLNAHVWLNGESIDRYLWSSIIPKADDLVVFRIIPMGGDGKNPIGLILTIAVVALSLGIATGALLPGLGAYQAAMVAAGVSMVGMLAINAIAPPPMPKMDTISGSEAAAKISPSIAGGKNPYNPYGPVPVVLGTARITPPHGSDPITEVVGNDLYLRQIFLIGHDKIEISDLRIGETSIDYFSDVEYNVVYPGEPLELFKSDISQESLSILMSNDNAEINFLAQAAVDLENGLVGINSTLHGLVSGDIIKIYGTANYNGTFEVHSSTTDSQIVIDNGSFTPEDFSVTDYCKNYFWEVRTTAAGTEVSVVDLVFPQGLVQRDDENNKLNRTVDFEIQYAPTGTDMVSGSWSVGNDFVPISAQNSDVLVVPDGYWQDTNCEEFTGCSQTFHPITRTYYIGIDKSTGVVSSNIGRTVSFFNLVIVRTPPEQVHILAEITLTTGDTVPTIVDKRRTNTAFGDPVNDFLVTQTDPQSLAVTVSAGTLKLETFATANSNDTLRLSFPFNFATPGSYDIRVRRVTADSTSDYVQDQFYWNSLKSEKLTVAPITVKNITAIEMRIKSTEQLSGVVDTFNCLARNVSITRYNSVDDAWVDDMRSSNPADLYRYVLQGSANKGAVVDAKIDLDELEDWHINCLDTRHIINDLGVAVERPGGIVGIPKTAHAIPAGTHVIIINTTNYDGEHIVLDSSTTNEVRITATYVAEPFDSSSMPTAASIIVPGLSYNKIIDYQSSVNDILTEIAASGKASPGYFDGKFSVVQDKQNTTPVQHFTPRNSFGFSSTKAFYETPHAWKVRFINELEDYRQDERIVYADTYGDVHAFSAITISFTAPDTITDSGNGFGNFRAGDSITVSGTVSNNGVYTIATATSGTITTVEQTLLTESSGISFSIARNATEFEELELPGSTHPVHVFKLARYHMATVQLRPEVHTFNTDIEYIVCTRGDLVLVSHDVPAWKNNISSGRIKSLTLSGADITHITLDEICTFEIATDYCVRVRLNDMTSSYHNVENPGAGDTNIIELSVPVNAVASGINVGDLITFGERLTETVEMVVKSIIPQGDMTAKISAVDASPAVHTAAEGTIPAFDSRVRLSTDPLATIGPPIISSVRSGEEIMTRDLAGILQPRVLVTLSLQDIALRYVDLIHSTNIAYKVVGSDSPWKFVQCLDGKIGVTAYLTDVEVGAEYDIRAFFTLSINGSLENTLRSDPVLHTVIGKTSLPDVPTAFNIYAGKLMVSLRTMPPVDPHIAAVEIWRNTVNTFPGGDALFSTPVVFGSPNTKVTTLRDSDVIAGTPYYYWTGTLDLYGNRSATQLAYASNPVTPLALIFSDITDDLPGTIVIDGTTTTLNDMQVATVNFDGRNDRIATAISAPTILTNGTAVDHTLNTDGSCNISFEWSWSGTEADIDGFLVFVRGVQTDTGHPYTILNNASAEEHLNIMRADKRALILSGIPIDNYYTFGIAAYRIVDPDINSSGYILSNIAQPSLGAENPYRPSATVAFAGDVTGTIDGTSATDVVIDATAGATFTSTNAGSLAYQDDADWSADITGTGKPTDNADVTAPMIGCKIGYVSFTSVNPGEVFFHGFNSAGVPADVNPSILINGIKTELTKDYANPGLPIGDCYIIAHLTPAVPEPVRYYFFATKIAGVWKAYPETGGAVIFTPNAASQWVIGTAYQSAAEVTDSATVWQHAQALSAVPDTGADSTQDAIEAQITITGGGIVIDNTGATGDIAVSAGKTSHIDTTPGFFLGYDNTTNSAYTFHIGNATDSLEWDGTNLAITGNISASTGAIGGFTVGASSLEAGTGVTHIEFSTASGIWLGADTFGAAPFSVSLAGALTASNATITGEINATSGVIGGFTATATDFKAGTGVTHIELEPATGIWMGADTFGSAPFRVTPAGALTASNATITGSITASTGAIGNWSIGANTISSTNVTLDSANQQISIGSTTFGADGIQLDYDATAGPRAYMGNGTTQYLKFDGIDLSWKGTNAELTTEGQLSVSDIFATGGTIGGWSLDATTISSGGIELKSGTAGNSYIMVGSAANPRVEITSGGLQGYDSELGLTFDLPTDGGAPYFSSGIINEVVYQLYNAAVIKTSDDPATTGPGLVINNAGMTGYSDDATPVKLFHVSYSGVTKGDFYAGDYDNAGAGIKYDHDLGLLNIRGAISLTSPIPESDISGLGSLATQSTVDYGTDVSGTKPPSDADNTSANETFGSTTAINTAYGYTPEANVSLSNLPADTPSGTGLFMDATHLGYYNTSVWSTYMGSNGDFYLGGAAGKLQWDHSTSTLTISGNITIENTIPNSVVSGLGSLATVNSIGGTNLITQSETFGNTSLSGATLVAGTYTLPDASSGTAYLLTKSATGLNIRFNHAIRGNGTHTFSIWAKTTVGTTDLIMDIRDRGAIGKTATTTWQRFSRTVDVTAYDNTTYHFADIAISGANGSAVVLWHPQCETGGTATDWSVAPEDVENPANYSFGPDGDFDLSSLTTPSTAGLYLGADYLGYYNAGWKTYMDNTGNFYLGGSQGALTWDGTDLNISGNITLSNLNNLNVVNDIITSSASIVDVFLYDTSQDSDGGAWRKRCQNLSWYNEALNTSTRGATREFPAIALIVAESNKVTIYDATDPALPMWMVFSNNSAGIIGSSSVVVSSIAAGNGSIYFGGTQGISLISFLGDSSYRWRKATGVLYEGAFLGYIAERNIGKGYAKTFLTFIVDNTINDIAITVLPNAPIDPATGLPVPTIAVGTVAGTSVIKDDGTVVSGGETNETWHVGRLYFDSTNRLWASIGNNQSYGGLQIMSDPPYSTVTAIGITTASGYPRTTNLSDTYGVEANWPRINGSTLALTWANTLHVNGGTRGVTLLQENRTTPTDGMVNYITKDSQSGWMHGDIKGAWLADTNLNPELVTNSEFTTDITGWTPSGLTDLVTDGVVTLTNSGGSNGTIYQSIDLTVGQTYEVTSLATNGTGTARVYYGASYQIPNGVEVSNVFIATTETLNVSCLVLGADGTTASFDYLSVRKVEQIGVVDLDRSVNNDGLEVHGQLIKSPVAYGSELVGYSGFSATDYLEQPYNSNLDFGTGDFYVMGWVEFGSVASRQDLLSIAGTTGDYVLCSLISSTDFRFQVECGTSAVNANQTTAVPAGVPLFYVGVRDSDGLHLYINGELVETTAQSSSSESFDLPADAVLNIGIHRGTNPSGNTSMALWRIGAGAPSAEQIEYIYNTEKHLFTANSACTLSGTSNAVATLSNDDLNNLLYVGTGDGVSVFNNCNRADYIDSTGPLTSDNIKAVSASQGSYIIGSAAESVASIKPINLRDDYYGGVITADKVNVGGVEMSSQGYIKGGQASYDSGTGFFLGLDNGEYKFSIGNSAGNNLTWDGTDLSLTGSISATGGSISGGLSMGTTGKIAGGQSFWDIGAGFFLGYESGHYRFSLGDGSGARLAWSGTTLSIGGNVNCDAGTVFTGPTIQTSASGQRFVVSSDDEAKWYDSSGTLVGTLGVVTFGFDYSILTLGHDTAQYTCINAESNGNSSTAHFTKNSNGTNNSPAITAMYSDSHNSNTAYGITGVYTGGGLACAGVCGMANGVAGTGVRGVGREYGVKASVWNDSTGTALYAYAYIGTGLHVDRGDAQFDEDVTVDGSITSGAGLTVTGNAQLNDNLYVEGDMQLGSAAKGGYLKIFNDTNSFSVSPHIKLSNVNDWDIASWSDGHFYIGRLGTGRLAIQNNYAGQIRCSSTGVALTHSTNSVLQGYRTSAVTAGGQYLFNMKAGGHDGTALDANTFMVVPAGSAWTTSNHESHLDFYTTNNGSVDSTLKWRIHSSGTLYPVVASTDIGTSTYKVADIYAERVVGRRPTIHLSRTTTLDISGANGTVTYMGWNTKETYDYDSFIHNTAINNSRVTALTTGRYSIKANIAFTNAQVNRCTVSCYCRLNGTTLKIRGKGYGYHRGNVYGDANARFETELELTANDYIEIAVEMEDSDDGGTAAVNILQDECEVIIRRLD